MELEFKLKDKTLIVSISGEIDHHTSKGIREKVDKEINNSPINNLLFNFSKVSFMDSSGVGVIIGRYKVIQELGGKIGIIGLSPHIRRVFEISGLFKIIPFYANIQEALDNM